MRAMQWRFGSFLAQNSCFKGFAYKFVYNWLIEHFGDVKQKLHNNLTRSKNLFCLKSDRKNVIVSVIERILKIQNPIRFMEED